MMVTAMDRTEFLIRQLCFFQDLSMTDAVFLCYVSNLNGHRWRVLQSGLQAVVVAVIFLALAVVAFLDAFAMF
jgi:hypothetical protein